MKYPVIQISGKAGSGKDLTASIIASHYPNCAIISLADPLKQLVKHVFGFSDESLWGPSEMRSVPVECCINTIRDNVQNLPYPFKPIMYHVQNYVGDEFYNVPRYNDIMLTPRKVLQDIGTNVVRKHLPGFWIDLNKELVEHALQSGYYYERTTGKFAKGDRPVNLAIVPDARFKDEILAAKKAGYLTVRVVNSAETSADTHASEVSVDAISDFWFDAVLRNHKEYGIRGLERAVGRILKEHVSVQHESSDWVGV